MLKLNLSSPHMSITISKKQTQKDMKNPSKSNNNGLQPAMGILSILREALKISFWNGTVMVSIFLPMFLSYSLLAYGANLVLSPLLKDLILRLSLINNYHEGNEVDEFLQSGILKDVRHFLALQSVIWFFSCAIMHFFLVTTISSSSEAYIGKKVSGKDVFSNIKGRWKRTVITSVYMALIAFSLIVLFLFVFVLIPVMVDGTLMVGLLVVVAILGLFGYLYVAAIWMLSLVVSILEDDSCGLKAIDRAGELMKGKRVKGCVMKLLLALTSGVIFGTTFVKMRNSNHRALAVMPILITKVFVACLLKFFMFVMFTVFYHECKKSHEEVGAEGELGLYAPIAPEEA